MGTFVTEINEVIGLRRQVADLQGQLEQEQAEAAAMRKALLHWKALAHFVHDVIDWRTGKSLQDAYINCIKKGEQALSTTAGQPILAKMKAAEMAKDMATALEGPTCEGNGCCARCGETPQQNVLDMGGPEGPDGYERGAKR